MYLYIDIETVGNVELKWYELYQTEFLTNYVNELATKDWYAWETNYLYDKWALNPILWQICCISVGKYDAISKTPQFKSFFWYDEVKILTEFVEFIKPYKRDQVTYVGHNIIDFDIPYIQKRCLINGVVLPESLVTYWVAKYNLNVEDTMLMWDQGRGKKISLSMLSVCLGYENPKNDCDWSKVNNIYYEWNINDIVDYCEWDVSCTIKVHRRLRELLGL